MIATPAETHFPVASAAIAAGKDVFVEKPMTIDVADARALIEQADAAGRILMVGHLLEYHPAILKLRELVHSGELGKIRYVISNRLNLGKIRTEENALWSFAPHDIAVILRLVGTMPFEVVATGGCYVQPNIADVTVTQLLFDNGARSSTSSCRGSILQGAEARRDRFEEDGLLRRHLKEAHAHGSQGRVGKRANLSPFALRGSRWSSRRKSRCGKSVSISRSA